MLEKHSSHSVPPREMTMKIKDILVYDYLEFPRTCQEFEEQAAFVRSATPEIAAPPSIT